MTRTVLGAIPQPLAEAERRSSSDRRRSRGDRFHERRTGFDRRRAYPILGGLRQDVRFLVAVLLPLNAMSLLDGLLTALELEHGIAQEFNPALASVFASNPHLAIALKVCLLLLVSVCIWRWRRYRLVLGASLVGLGVFAAVLTHHLTHLLDLATF
jgi:hypothetical protein